MKKGISIVKKLKGAGFLSLPGKLPAPNNSRDFSFEIWERESAPAELLPDIRPFDADLESESAAEIAGR